jgi:hypothetical protein
VDANGGGGGGGGAAGAGGVEREVKRSTPQAELSALPIENLNALLEQLQKQLLPNGS